MQVLWQAVPHLWQPAQLAGLVRVLCTPVSCRYVLVKASKKNYFLFANNGLGFIYLFFPTCYLRFICPSTYTASPAFH